MGRCTNHPGRETSFGCMKHNVYMCKECLTCRDPELYCKFRSSCPIYFLTKRNSLDKPLASFGLKSMRCECPATEEPFQFSPAEPVASQGS